MLLNLANCEYYSLPATILLWICVALAGVITVGVVIMMFKMLTGKF